MGGHPPGSNERHGWVIPMPVFPRGVTPPSWPRLTWGGDPLPSCHGRGRARFQPVSAPPMGGYPPHCPRTPQLFVPSCVYVVPDSVSLEGSSRSTSLQSVSGASGPCARTAAVLCPRCRRAAPTPLPFETVVNVSCWSFGSVELTSILACGISNVQNAVNSSFRRPGNVELAELY